MPYTTINKPSLYFNTVLYTGNGSNNYSVTGNDFSADFIWFKCRSAGLTEHHLTDIIRGFGTGSSNTPTIQSNSTSAEFQRNIFSSTGVTSTGFSLNNYSDTNTNGATFAAWCWDANGAGVSNTSGTITSTVSANTTSGFSIVSYTGDGVNNRTVGHGLGATPKFIIIKNRSAGTAFWSVINPRSTSTTDTNILYLNRTDAEADDTNIMGTNLPNSTTFGIGNYAGVNVNAQNFIAYCFAPIKGYSAMGQYTGNGSTDGTFIYTGFKPAWVLWKNTTTAGTNWVLMDNKRNTYNPENLSIAPNTSDAEADFSSFPNDFLSNGFKLRNTGAGVNASGSTYIYAAFAENPFVSSTLVPTTAR